MVAATAPAGDLAEIEFTETTMEIGMILDKYEQLTQRHTMREAAVQGTLPLKSNGKMTRTQAIEFIRAYLLLNGIGIVPSDVESTDKVLMIQQRLPTIEQGEGVRAVYSDPDDLPKTEKVINFVMYFKNISPDDALRSLQTAVQGHPYARLVSVPQAGALIITDTVPVVRLAIALREKIDVPSARVVKKFFQLERADAEDVATVITDILAAQSRLRSQQSGGAARSVAVNLAAQAMNVPPGVNPGERCSRVRVSPAWAALSRRMRAPSSSRRSPARTRSS